MNINPRRAVILICISVVVALSPAIIRTVDLCNTGDGLITLASLNEDQLSSNPWNQDFYLITPNMAVWVLEEFEWPHNNREPANVIWSNAPFPFVQQALAARRLSPDTAHADARLFRLLEVFVDRGESIEDRYRGYTPLHSAILFADIEAVKFLVENGADTAAKLDNEGKASDGLSAVEFSNLLFSKDPEQFRDIDHYLGSLLSDE